jgi:putative hydrolase
MSDIPFGFGSANREPGEPGGSGGEQPAGFGFGDLGGDLAGKIPLFAELQKLFSASGPVNWDLARQVATSALTATHVPVTPADRDAAEQAVRLADLWLDDVTDLPSGVSSTQAWTRIEWVERTLPVWGALCDPVATHVATAMTTGLPEEIRAQAGPMAPLMTQLGGMMFGSQVGQALGGLAGEVVSGTDIGLPLGPVGVAALVPVNIAEFAAGLDRSVDEVRLYIALREAAHQRLFAHVPWLRQRLIDTVDAYARGIVIDTSTITQLMGEIDPTNPESLQNALSNGMFEPQDTPAQQAALRRLETLLALVEGWVDAVVGEVAGQRLGGAAPLQEAFRRRRASGGPAEATFATLVGLELRPRKLREASALWSTAAERLGRSGRDALWEHPDLLPDNADLDDPDGFLLSKQGVTDEALNALLDGAAAGDPDVVDQNNASESSQSSPDPADSDSGSESASDPGPGDPDSPDASGAGDR